jgi:predicted acyl esterase
LRPSHHGGAHSFVGCHLAARDLAGAHKNEESVDQLANGRLGHCGTIAKEKSMQRHLLLSLLPALFLWVNGLCTAKIAAAAVTPTSTVMVPMRDGTLLATDIYLPAGDGPWPVALARTPYGRTDFRNPSGGHGGIPSISFLTNGMALVVQDVRGTGASKGEALFPVNEGWGEHQDGLDTVNWIRSQPWCNGKLATYGGSALGTTQLLLAGAGPQGVVGQYIRSAPGSRALNVYLNGVWRKSVESVLTSAQMLAFRAHPHYDDFWRGLDLGTRLDQVHWPMVHMTGWYDYYLQGVIDDYTELQENGSTGARGQQHLLIGPWVHLPDIYTGHVTRAAGVLTFPKNAVLPPDTPDGFGWLSFWLTGQPAVPLDEPAVRYYVMGDVTDPQAPGNVWRTAASWPPPAQPLRLYFTTDGRLDPQPPAMAATREYDYDPTKPVPTVGGQEAFLAQVGAQDQRKVENRPDVLVFTTAPLTAPLEVTGRISVHLNAATSAKDTDFTAKLTDFYPDGRSMLLADGIVRARFRQSLETETLITPGQQYGYDIDLWSTSIIFNKGHQIRVAISSSNSPRFEPNPNTGGPLPPDPKEKPVVAHQTIFLGGSAASYITLPQIQ